MAQQAENSVAAASSIDVTVENVGGIDHADVSVSPGVTVFRGRNATNRTSFLSAVDSALGGSSGSLKSDADEGSVVLQVGDVRYTRTFRREADDVRIGGNPYTTEQALVDSFVSLLEDNPARRAVERGEDLREIIMRPIDTDEIEEQIETCQAEKNQLEDRIEHVSEQKDRLPTLEERRQSLEEQQESIETDIETLRSAIDEYEADHSTAAAADSIVEDLDEARQEHKRIQNDIEVTEAEIESLEAELDEFDDGGTGTEYTEEDLDDVKEELAVARERRRQIDESINALFTIVEFNQDLLDGSFELPGIEPEEAGPAAELAPDDERDLVCWTCGGEVTRQDVDERLDALRAVIDEKRTERVETEDRVSELEERREHIESTLEASERRRRERSTKRDQLAEKREHLATLESRASTLADRIAHLETEVAETQQLRDDDLLEMYEQLSDLQYERGQLQQRRSDIAAEIEAIQSLPAVAALTEERDELREEIADHRARIDRLEARTVAAFNEHMDELLGVLEYDNVARVWIEKRTGTGAAAGDGSFELHVIREDVTGTGYEEQIDNLSESERELIGLVFALAGYLSHEVYEEIPFMLLDSLEAMDSPRVARLVDHFAQYTDVLLLALLPEDARAVDDRHEQRSANVLA